MAKALKCKWHVIKLEEVKLNGTPGINQEESIFKDSYNNLIIFDTISYKSLDGGLNWIPLTNSIWPLDYNLKRITFIDSLLFITSNDCNNPLLKRYYNFDFSQ